MDTGRSGADKGDPLALVGIARIPSGRVEYLALEILDPFNLGEFRVRELARRIEDEVRSENLLLAVGSRDPDVPLA